MISYKKLLLKKNINEEINNKEKVREKEL